MQYRYWLLVLLCLSACAQDTLVEVFVSGLSPEVTSLQVTAKHGEESESQNFQQNLGSFAIRLPAGATGPLTLTVHGRTAQSCTVLVGQQEVQLVPSGYTSTTVVLVPAPLSVGSFSPAQGPSTGGPVITITGQGFGPGSVVRFDGIATETVPTAQTSSCQLTAFLPPNPGASRMVSVTVRNPDNQQASSPDKFFYYLGQLAFERQPGTTTGKSPSSVALGDVNGDGHPDLTVANYDASTVSVLLGKGDGSFRPKLDFPTGNGPSSVALGDVNGDGHPDLAVSNYSYRADTVSVLLGKGDGTFLPKLDFPTSSSPSSVALGDVNGDGHPDLAVANFGAYTVSVLLGKGDGTFLPKQDFPTGYGPTWVALGDA